MTYQLHTVGFHYTDQDVADHHHAQAECILPLAGNIFIHCNGHRYELGPGQCLYMPAGTVHDQVHPGLSQNYYLKIPELEELFGSAVQLIDLQGDELILRWCADLRSCTEQQQAGMDAVVSDLCNALIKRLAVLARISEEAEAYDAPLRRALTLIEQHYADDLSLADIAAHAGISISHLGLLFRRHFNHSVMSHVQDMRMRHARRLLLDDYRQVTEIGAACGYPDPNYFARQFRRQHGLSPRAWRQRHNN